LAIGPQVRSIVVDPAIDACAIKVDAGPRQALAQVCEDFVIGVSRRTQDQPAPGYGRQQGRPCREGRARELVEIVEAAEGDVAGAERRQWCWRQRIAWDRVA